ncbi:MAG: hypothetical protein HGA45_38415, partial [Chloroflexales bacterium]|nr:hypothetical protein [Chloroflexales bacterium]
MVAAFQPLVSVAEQVLEREATRRQGGDEGVIARDVGRRVRATVELDPRTVAHALGQPRYQLQGTHKVTFDIGAHRVKLRVGPVDDDEGLLIVGGAEDDHPVGARIQLRALDGDIAPVRVVGAGARGPLLVGGRLDLARHQRVVSIGADHD